MRLLLRNKILTAIIAGLSVLYLVQTAFLSQDQTALHKYNLSNSQGVLLGLTITLPYIGIWVVALIGYIRLKTYAKLIARSPDGAGFNLISKGLLGLTLYLPLQTIIGNFFMRGYRFHHSWAVPMVWLRNYFLMVLLFVSFTLIYLGARKLMKLVDTPLQTEQQHASIGLFGGMIAIYLLVILHDPSRRLATSGSSLAAYYLSDWLIIVTIIVPRIIMWYLGLKAVHYIYMYRNGIAGTLYRDSLERIASGLAFVLVSTIMLRYVESLSKQLNNLNLGAVLIVLYGFLVFIGVGYLLIYKGACKLQKIEEL